MYNSVAQATAALATKIESLQTKLDQKIVDLGYTPSTEEMAELDSKFNRLADTGNIVEALELVHGNLVSEISELSKQIDRYTDTLGMELITGRQALRELKAGKHVICPAGFSTEDGIYSIDK